MIIGSRVALYYFLYEQCYNAMLVLRAIYIFVYIKYINFLSASYWLPTWNVWDAPKIKDWIAIIQLKILDKCLTYRLQHFQDKLAYKIITEQQHSDRRPNKQYHPPRGRSLLCRIPPKGQSFLHSSRWIPHCITPAWIFPLRITLLCVITHHAASFQNSRYEY